MQKYQNKQNQKAASASESEEHHAYSTLPRSKDAVQEARNCFPSPQTESPSYRLAFDDLNYLLQDEQRAVRLLLEWNKPDQTLRANNVEATWAVFGSARIRPTSSIEERLAALNVQSDFLTNPHLQKEANKLEKIRPLAVYYDECKKLCRLLSDSDSTGVEATVITGGGPGIMEAANLGAAEANASSIGLNIVLPSEQQPNPFITPEYCFQFHYFAIRKMHFLVRAKALFAFPGGYGTLDEVIETLTLLQTRRIHSIPVLLFGERFWKTLVNFEFLAEQGLISESDLKLFEFVETAEEAIAKVKAFYLHEQPNKVNN